MTYITWLRATEAKELANLGGKAHVIAQLAAAGFPIAEGFVLHPTALVDSLVEQRAFAVVGGATEPNLVPASPLENSQQIRDAIRQEIAQALARLCPQGELVAVRSSAVEEDSHQHSFAGQLESFLNVEPESVIERVLAVWRSAFSDRVLAYRQEHHLSAAPSPPAVLIQRMVDPVAAGVAFGADPVSGQRSITVIQAVAGLADQLVQGSCEANSYQVDRSGSIVQRQETEPGLLTDEQLQTIAQLTRQVGNYFGQPQDVEWALAADQLVILQSRPITTLEQTPDPDATFCLWDNSNIVESYNGITTPLTFSFARKAYEEVYKQFCYFMGVPMATIAQNQHIFRCMIGFIQGRIYYNLLSWYRMLALLPGTRVNARFMEQMMGVRETLPEQVVAELQQALRQNWLLDRWRLLTTLVSLVVNFFTLPLRIRRYYQRLDRALQLQDTVVRPADITTWRADELVAHYRTLEQDLLPHWDAPLITDFFAMIFYGLLRRCTEKWCGDSSGTLQNDLIGGEGGIVSAEPLQRMQAMAQLIHDRPDLIQLLCQAPISEILKQIQQIPEFQQQYQAYLDRFGDRCLEELKLESPTLHDDPLPLLRSIGRLANRRTATIPADHTPFQQRQQAEQRVNQALQGHPIRQLFFRWILRNARIQVRNRENLRFERTRVFGRARRIFLELGKRLCQVDRLSDPQQVFYLEVNEILGFVEGNITCTDLKGLVALRQAEFSRYAQQPAPDQRFETWGMVYQGNSFQRTVQRTMSSRAIADGMAEMRQGVGCSPGQVRGVVRVITRSKQVLEQVDRPLEPGCILVAESTDPGWILLFPHAAGLLVERGSVLSHVAIVCRELGIPMITSLPGITQWLQDGELVELDSATGRVQKLTATT